MALQDIIKKINTPKVGVEVQSLAPEPVQPVEQFPNMSPEEIEVYKSLDENKPVLEQLYRKTVQKPKEISEKGMKAAQTASHIGNSLGILADMFGASQGARVARRDSKLVDNQIANERAIRGQNEAENNQYNAGLLNAQFSDAQQKAQGEREKRAYMVSLVKQSREEKAQAAKDAQKYNQWLAEMGLKASEANRRKFEADRGYNLDVKKANKVDGKSEKDKKFTGVVISARQDDPKAQQDASGNKVIKYDMTPEEVNNVANKAKRDTKFLERHPELYITTRNPISLDVTRGLTKDEEVAWAYLQEQYDNSKPAPIKTKQKLFNNEYLPGGSKSPIKSKSDPLGLGL